MSSPSASVQGAARNILDLDAFYCAVKEQRDPALRGRAFAVSDHRALVLAFFYRASPISMSS